MYIKNNEKMRNTVLGRALIDLLDDKVTVSAENLILRIQELAKEEKGYLFRKACGSAVAELIRGTGVKNSGSIYEQGHGLAGKMAGNTKH